MSAPSSPSYSERLADWAVGVRFDDLPEAVVAHTKQRIVDVVGLAIAGADTAFGRSVLEAIPMLHPAGSARVWATGLRTSAVGAAFANGALSQALEFDDTHNRSVVHMSSPAVAAALGLADTMTVSGRSLITAIAVGNELSCRIGSVAPEQFHRRGFHPTAMFAPFGATGVAGRLLELDAGSLAHAFGIVGSFASGLLQCWVDGTQTKFLHPGWAAQSGIVAATLGLTGTTGPAEVIEGRWGLMDAHLQSAEVRRDYDQLTADLGTHWESELASFKPFPVAHVIHPYIDAILRLREEYRIFPEDVERIVCPIAAYQVGIVCEPLSEKLTPRTDSHGRVSLQFTLAEALATGRIDRRSYAPETLSDPRIQALAARVEYVVDPDYPGPEQFKGEVRIVLRDGRVVETVEEHNRGSAANPMSPGDIAAKFHDNASARLTAADRELVLAAIDTLESADDVRAAIDRIVAGR